MSPDLLRGPLGSGVSSWLPRLNALCGGEAFNTLDSPSALGRNCVPQIHILVPGNVALFSYRLIADV